MPTLLIIARDDGFLPKGWVSAILPDHVTPSDYERTGGLFKTVIVTQAPALARSFDPAHPRLNAGAWVFADGTFLEQSSPRAFLAERLAARRSLLTTAPGPGGLDRSHSTVWDYGPGRTYSVPQSAFDALLMQVGGDPFAETHILRGFGGTYGPGPSGYVLHLTTAQPACRFPLVLDADPGHAPGFDDENGDACLVGDGVSHVRARELCFRRGFVGVAPTEDLPVLDWRIERCEADGAAGGLGLGVSVIRADDLVVAKCYLHDLLLLGVGGLSGFPDDYQTRVEIKGCRISAQYYGVWNNAEVSYLLANNTISAGFFGVRHEGTYPLIIAGMINNVFTGGENGFHCLGTDSLEPADVRIIHSDGNCFHPGQNGGVAALGQTNLDLEGFREWFGQDEKSFVAEPWLDANLVPRPGSPCLAAGVGWDDEGYSGKRRAASVDIGYEQVTAPRVATAIARQAPEIRRR